MFDFIGWRIRRMLARQGGVPLWLGDKEIYAEAIDGGADYLYGDAAGLTVTVEEEGEEREYNLAWLFANSDPWLTTNTCHACGKPLLLDERLVLINVGTALPVGFDLESETPILYHEDCWAEVAK